jgi:hypothetical protein
MSVNPNVTPLIPRIARKPVDPELFEVERERTSHDPAADTYLISDLPPGSGLGAIYGAPRSSKSFVALDIALRISQGWEWGGRRTGRTTFCIL